MNSIHTPKQQRTAECRTGAILQMALILHSAVLSTSLSSLVSGSKTQIQKTLHRNRNKFIFAVNQRKGPGELGIF